MKILQGFKNMMKIPQTKIGLVFAIFVPVFFMIVWMTGYNNATERLDQLNVGIVNEDGAASKGIAEQIAKNSPFHVVAVSEYEKAKEQLDKGKYAMLIVIPEKFANTMTDGSGELTFYVNEANSQVAVSMMEKAAAEISANLGAHSGVKADIVKTNELHNFAASMLPMILGFITYIAVMTMNIQFNLVGQIMKKGHSKWQIFWSRQMLLLIVALDVPTIIISLTVAFQDVAASFWKLWLFHVLVTAACISFTQMSFSLFGNAGPLFNVAMVPLQLMTAGNIIPANMLAPFYQHFGAFLPASNGVQGFTKLIYTGESVSVFAVHLVLLLLVTFVITIIRLATQKEKAANPALSAKQLAH